MARISEWSIEPFRTVHLDILMVEGVQGAQVRQVSHVPSGYATLVPPPGTALTVRAFDRIVFCGGAIELTHRSGLMWAVLSPLAREHMLRLHRATGRYIDTLRYERLEATVEKGFDAGCRWLTLLGFALEGESPGYGDQGETHLRYGRVRV